jgi:hypothetical protein
VADNIAPVHVHLIRAEGSDKLICLHCAGAFVPDNLDRHCRMHFVNHSENAQFCKVCNKDAGVGKSSIDAHNAGGAHEKINKNKKKSYCIEHLQTGHPNEESVPFAQLCEKVGLDCHTEEEKDVAAARVARSTVSRSVRIDAHATSTIVGLACCVGEKNDQLSGLLTPPVCDTCAAVQKINPKTVAPGVTVEESKEECSLCQKRKALNPLFVSSCAPRRRYFVSEVLLSHTYPYGGDKYTENHMVLPQVVSQEDWIAMKPEDGLKYEPATENGKLVMRLKVKAGNSKARKPQRAAEQPEEELPAEQTPQDDQGAMGAPPTPPEREADQVKQGQAEQATAGDSSPLKEKAEPAKPDARPSTAQANSRNNGTPRKPAASTKVIKPCQKKQPGSKGIGRK